MVKRMVLAHTPGLNWSCSVRVEATSPTCLRVCCLARVKVGGEAAVRAQAEKDRAVRS